MTKRNRIILLVGGIVVIVAAIFFGGECDEECQAEKGRENIEVASYGSLAAEMFKERIPGGVLLDISTSEEYAEAHIENAILINSEASDFKEQIKTLDRSINYSIYSRSLDVSQNTLETMESLKFKNVYYLEGDLDAWTAAGLPVASST